MWTCERCGEKHEDQFDSCWKCAGQSASEQAPVPVARPTRGLGWIVVAALAGIAVGMVLGGTIASRWSGGDSFAVFIGGLIGAILGLPVGALGGTIVWALFPYRGEGRSGGAA